MWRLTSVSRVSVSSARTRAPLVQLLALLVFVPSLASAQAQITGTVVDASGAVLPGVTVEASSSALIERTRAGVTDAAGQYRLVDLRPGVGSDQQPLLEPPLQSDRLSLRLHLARALVEGE